MTTTSTIGVLDILEFYDKHLMSKVVIITGWTVKGVNGRAE
jgi:hypothetical protein